MNCLSSCFGKSTKTRTHRGSIDEKSIMTVKCKEILKFDQNILNKKPTSSVSPFRVKPVGKSGMENFHLEDNTVYSNNSKDLSPNNKKNHSKHNKGNDEYLKHASPIFGKLKSKQRFSSMNMNLLATLSKINKDKDNEIVKFNQVHWEKKDKIKCLFCGGATCKHENYLNNKNANNAINGLHSDFINEDIIASQRPSTLLIKKYNLIQRFKELNIGLIVNVQREGEHPYCGPNKKLEDSGFSYNPHIFLSADVKCRCSGWKDMSVPQSVHFMIEIVKEMCVFIKEKSQKVLVHCHAGYGRTGVVIACYLIYNSSKSTDEIIRDIRKIRSACIQDKDQYTFCDKFREYIRKARILFDLNEQQNGAKKQIEFFMKNQKDILFGAEAETFEHIPKLIYKILERLVELKRIYNIELKLFYASLCIFEEWNPDHEQVLNSLKNSLNRGQYNLLSETENINIISQLLFDWLEDDIEFVINPQKLSTIMEEINFSKELEYLIENSSHSLHSQKNKDSIKVLVEYLKNLFGNVEFTTLEKFAYFFEEIYPENEREIDSFLNMVDRFSVHLLGYKYTEVYLSEDATLFQTIKKIVTSLSNIIRLFILAIKLDYRDILTDSNRLSKTNNSKMHSRTNTGISTSQRKSSSSFYLKELENMRNLKEGSMTNKTVDLKNFDFDVVMNNLKNMSDDAKEKFLFKMYETLGTYFLNNKKRKGSEISGLSNFSMIQREDNNGYSHQGSFGKLSNGKKPSFNVSNIYGKNPSDNEEPNTFIDYIKNFFDGRNDEVIKNKERKSIKYSLYNPQYIINEVEDNNQDSNLNEKEIDFINTYFQKKKSNVSSTDINKNKNIGTNISFNSKHHGLAETNLKKDAIILKSDSFSRKASYQQKENSIVPKINSSNIKINLKDLMDEINLSSNNEEYFKNNLAVKAYIDPNEISSDSSKISIKEIIKTKNRNGNLNSLNGKITNEDIVDYNDPNYNEISKYFKRITTKDFQEDY